MPDFLRVVFGRDALRRVTDIEADRQVIHDAPSQITA
jgi:hypothetical protein